MNLKTHPPSCERKAERSITLHLQLLCLCIVVLLLGGCSDMVLFHPKGPIAETVRFVIVVAFALMLIVVIPVMVMAFWFPWKFRADNPKTKYAPKWSYSLKIELVVWTIPAIIVTCLGILIWHTTYDVDPYKPLESEIEPLTIEVVSLDWKWLFIYPGENIAAVNELVFPANVPLSFRLTSNSVMTSFFIPQLGSQIYAMAGMETKLHLMADETGAFFGHNQQYSGEGYSDMKFQAIAVTPEQFDAWLEKARNTGQLLDPARFGELQTPSGGYHPVTYFSPVTPGLFDHIIARFMTSEHKAHSAASSHADSAPMAAALKED